MKPKYPLSMKICVAVALGLMLGSPLFGAAQFPVAMIGLFLFAFVGQWARHYGDEE